MGAIGWLRRLLGRRRGVDGPTDSAGESRLSGSSASTASTASSASTGSAHSQIDLDGAEAGTSPGRAHLVLADGTVVEPDLDRGARARLEYLARRAVAPPPPRD
ncbi:MAG TPA: hypothetical protein VIG64_13170 [Actinomycetota bacterium]|jgi:hypothetical protein